MNDSPSSSRAFFNTGMAVFPIPCNLNVSSSEYFESCFSVLIPAFSNARLAGAYSKDKKPSFGLLPSSQVGQVGQSLLL